MLPTVVIVLMLAFAVVLLGSGPAPARRLVPSLGRMPRMPCA